MPEMLRVDWTLINPAHIVEATFTPEHAWTEADNPPDKSLIGTPLPALLHVTLTGGATREYSGQWAERVWEALNYDAAAV